MQHKREAFWFYRYLSRFYDRLVNPLFWTEPMRDKALDLVDWSDVEDLRVIDVGSGTGFTTRGIVARVPAHNVVCVDQSPQQMERAMTKQALVDCRFRLGDAENLPFPDDTFDRYVSAGSIEYWPNPQRGVDEAYRVVKEGGQVLLIGPIQPENPVSRFVADTWMLFPSERQYHRYFRQAGFADIRTTYVSPHWQRNERYGIAIVGTKPAPGASPNTMVSAPRWPVREPEPRSWLGQSLLLPWRVAIGSLAGFVFIPIALISHATAPLRGLPAADDYQPLNREQKLALGGLAVLAGLALYRLWRPTRGN